MKILRLKNDGFGATRWILLVRNPPQEGMLALQVTTVGIVIGGGAVFIGLSCMGHWLLKVEGAFVH